MPKGKFRRKGVTNIMSQLFLCNCHNHTFSCVSVFRMNKLIMQWPSEQLYNNKLVAADSVSNHRLCDLNGVKETDNTKLPVVFMDTAGKKAYFITVL